MIILTFLALIFSVYNVVIVSLNYPDDSSGPEVCYIFNTLRAFSAGLQGDEHYSGGGYLNVSDIRFAYLPGHFK